MKNISNTILMVILLVSVFSCKQDTDKEDNEVSIKKPIVENYNISILIDLSDRISLKKNPNLTMEYYQRDLGYIKSVSEAFTQHLKEKRIRQIDDKMQLFFNPEPLDPKINSISKDLKIAIDKNNATKVFLNSINANYAAQTSKIYDSAIKDDNYIGSDIWSFFDSKVKDQCIENGYRNILVILTDGYLFYDGTLIKEKNRSTYVLVLGINPSKSNPYEEKVIKAYWTKWFTEMNIKHFEIKNADLPSNMEKIIEGFILKKTK
jgi:hypothetical protein